MTDVYKDSMGEEDTILASYFSISNDRIETIYNDIMQGKAKHLGVIMCGTPQCVEDTRRGIFSYEALR